MSRVLPVQAPLPQPGTARAWLAERAHGARLHAGIDLGRAGYTVRAPEAGVVWGVVAASYGDDEPRTSTPAGWAGYGPRVVIVEGDSGAWHVLAHVDHPSVRVGQRVTAGQSVAEVAARGNHLHWEVRSRARPPAGWATVEVALDPLAWLEGSVRPWSRETDGCPSAPQAEGTRTPRACRPGAQYVPPVPGREEAPQAPPRPTARRGAPSAPRRGKGKTVGKKGGRSR